MATPAAADATASKEAGISAMVSLPFRFVLRLAKSLLTAPSQAAVAVVILAVVASQWHAYMPTFTIGQLIEWALDPSVGPGLFLGGLLTALLLILGWLLWSLFSRDSGDLLDLFTGGIAGRAAVIDTPGTPPEPGAVGLANLGNSCYMNSTLQALSAVPDLTAYFISGEYRRHLNTANPLGSGGDIAHAYAALLRQMWGGRLVYAAPAAFKAAVGRHLPQFAGREQQDNQEFLTALLDRLHEDLNQGSSLPASARSPSAHTYRMTAFSDAHGEGMGIGDGMSVSSSLHLGIQDTPTSAGAGAGAGEGSSAEGTSAAAPSGRRGSGSSGVLAIAKSGAAASASVAADADVDDATAASAAWSAYVGRNRSIIADKLQAQQVTRTICPPPADTGTASASSSSAGSAATTVTEAQAQADGSSSDRGDGGGTGCGAASRAFDSFMYVCLPLPPPVRVMRVRVVASCAVQAAAAGQGTVPLPPAFPAASAWQGGPAPPPPVLLDYSRMPVLTRHTVRLPLSAGHGTVQELADMLRLSAYRTFVRAGAMHPAVLAALTGSWGSKASLSPQQAAAAATALASLPFDVHIIELAGGTMRYPLRADASVRGLRSHALAAYLLPKVRPGVRQWMMIPILHRHRVWTRDPSAAFTPHPQTAMPTPSMLHSRAGTAGEEAQAGAGAGAGSHGGKSGRPAFDSQQASLTMAELSLAQEILEAEAAVAQASAVLDVARAAGADTASLQAAHEALEDALVMRASLCLDDDEDHADEADGGVPGAATASATAGASAGAGTHGSSRQSVPLFHHPVLTEADTALPPGYIEAPAASGLSSSASSLVKAAVIGGSSNTPVPMHGSLPVLAGPQAVFPDYFKRVSVPYRSLPLVVRLQEGDTLLHLRNAAWLWAQHCWTHRRESSGAGMPPIPATPLPADMVAAAAAGAEQTSYYAPSDRRLPAPPASAFASAAPRIVWSSPDGHVCGLCSAAAEAQAAAANAALPEGSGIVTAAPVSCLGCDLPALLPDVLKTEAITAAAERAAADAMTTAITAATASSAGPDSSSSKPGRGKAASSAPPAAPAANIDMVAVRAAGDTAGTAAAAAAAASFDLDVEAAHACDELEHPVWTAPLDPNTGAPNGFPRAVALEWYSERDMPRGEDALQLQPLWDTYKAFAAARAAAIPRVRAALAAKLEANRASAAAAAAAAGTAATDSSTIAAHLSSSSSNGGSNTGGGSSGSTGAAATPATPATPAATAAPAGPGATPAAASVIASAASSSKGKGKARGKGKGGAPKPVGSKAATSSSSSLAATQSQGAAEAEQLYLPDPAAFLPALTMAHYVRGMVWSPLCIEVPEEQTQSLAAAATGAGAGASAGDAPLVATDDDIPVTLTDCLGNLYGRESRLSEGNLYECGRCKRRVAATQVTWLVRPPQVLTIVLKRFVAINDFGDTDKLEGMVTFPLHSLSLDPYILPQARHQGDGAGHESSTAKVKAKAKALPSPAALPRLSSRSDSKSRSKSRSESRSPSAASAGTVTGGASSGAQAKQAGPCSTSLGSPASGTGPCSDRYVYDLFAVVNHTGTLTGGHYTAMARHPISGVWYSYNDHLVRAETAAVKLEEGSSASTATVAAAATVGAGGAASADVPRPIGISAADVAAGVVSSPLPLPIGSSSAGAGVAASSQPEDAIEEGTLRKVVERLRARLAPAPASASALATSSDSDTAAASRAADSSDLPDHLPAGAALLGEDELRRIIVTPSAYVLFYRRRGT